MSHVLTTCTHTSYNGFNTTAALFLGLSHTLMYCIYCLECPYLLGLLAWDAEPERVLDTEVSGRVNLRGCGSATPRMKSSKVLNTSCSQRKEY